MQRNTWSNTQRSWLLTGFPLIVALLVLKTVLLFFQTVPALAGFLNHLVFVAPDSIKTPWTLLTYSVVVERVIDGRSFINFLFELGLLYWFGSSLERSWGTRTFAWFFAAVTAVTALSISIGAWVLHTQFIGDHLLPVAACALAWGLVNADEEVSLFFIPMRGIYMSLVAVGFVMFQFAGRQPSFVPSPDGVLTRVAYETSGWWGVPFALVGCGLAWLWIRNGWQYGFGTLLPNAARPAKKRAGLRLVPEPKPSKPKDDRFTLRDLSPLEWIAKRRRRKQFEKLMNDD